MAKRKAVVEIFSYGEYSKWDRESKSIPKILKFTTEIEAEIGTEFGYVLRIKNGKGKLLSFKIDHPPFTDDEGNVRPPFAGEQYIRTNDFEFYLGDCVWAPLEDKLGKWEIITYLETKIVAQKTFHLVRK
ncbi:DUF3859 domain-containing protein [Maribellus comscasis]|uniref:DUF3859 domain-containing protein n=1 Tax=Maribellus comscasis TaxID=2681766 RepID=A0A6I6JU62_9BACT|nr:DUF3859 domain-containing protein [Maribellus comscasis]QGY43717.1 DUF3859 domain-containing protein [Maribellus comscasis]